MAFQINLILLFAHASAIVHNGGFEVMPDGNSAPEDRPRGSSPNQVSFEETGSHISSPPVIVSGICDSGTRGVINVLMNTGLKVCKKALHPDYNPNTLDSTITNPLNHRIHPILLENKGLHFNQQAKASHFTEAVNFERQAAEQTHQCIAEESGHSAAEAPWGYKNPDHIFLLPVLDKAFNHHAKYLIVARDPRDVCTAKNQFQFSHWGKNVLQGQTDDCYQFWAMTWKEVLRNYGRSKKARIVRIEDLVMPDPSKSDISKKTLKRTLKFIGVGKKWHPIQLNAQLNAQLKEMHKYKGEYMLHHDGMTDEDRQNQLLKVRQRKATDNQLLFDIMGQLGYDTSKIALTTPKADIVIHHGTVQYSSDGTVQYKTHGLGSR